MQLFLKVMKSSAEVNVRVLNTIALFGIGLAPGLVAAQTTFNFDKYVADHGGSVREAFIEVLSDARQQPGATIKFTAKRYQVKGSILHGGVNPPFEIPTETTLDGEGPKRTVIEVNMTVSPHEQWSLFHATVNGAVTISDMELVGKDVTSPNYQSTAIWHLGGSGTMTLRNVKFRGFSSPVKKALGSSNVLMQGCELTCRQSAFFTSGGGGRYDIRNCWFHDIGEGSLNHALYLKGPWDYINVVGNRFERIASAGIHRYGKDNSVVVTTAGPVLIWDNIFERCREWGIILNGDFNYEARIIGNEIRECPGEGIRIQSSNVDVSANTIWAATGILGGEGAESQPSSQVRIVGNTLIARPSPSMSAGSWWGIAVQYPCRDWTIEGNRVVDEGAGELFTGVQLLGARDCVIQGNEFQLRGDLHRDGSRGLVTSSFDDGQARRVRGVIISQNVFRGLTGKSPNDGAIQIVGPIDGDCELNRNHFAVDLDIREMLGASSECEGQNWSLDDWSDRP
jgi:hypothetical protein